jgi:fatty acyl-CoA reductase
MTVVTDWYSGQTVLVTGGTGFMGKVLLEKLLRCCSGVRRIYVMARPRRGKAPSTRLEEITKLPASTAINPLKPSGNNIYHLF